MSDLKGRVAGAQSLAAGALCWAIDLAMVNALGRYSVTLALFGAAGILGGSMLLLWGDSFRTMPLSQKIPAVLISLALVGLATTGFFHLMNLLPPR